MTQTIAQWLTEEEAAEWDRNAPWVPEETPGLLEQLSKRVQEQTPDFRERKSEKYIPVFVYGTLKRGGHLNDYIGSSLFVGDAMTSSIKWDLHTNGGFPIMRPAAKPEDFESKVRGEVYLVDPLTLLVLDRIENNGRMYQREKILVSCFDQMYKTDKGMRPQVINAWAYVGVPEYWKDVDLQRCPYEIMGQTYISTFPVRKAKFGR